MIILGIVALLLGFLLHVSILWVLGIVLVVVGIILALMAGAGRTVGGRSHWY